MRYTAGAERRPSRAKLHIPAPGDKALCGQILAAEHSNDIAARIKGTCLSCVGIAASMKRIETFRRKRSEEAKALGTSVNITLRFEGGAKWRMRYAVNGEIRERNVPGSRVRAGAQQWAEIFAKQERKKAKEKMDTRRKSCENTRA